MRKEQEWYKPKNKLGIFLGEGFKKELEIWEKSVGFIVSNNIHLLLRSQELCYNLYCREHSGTSAEAEKRVNWSSQHGLQDRISNSKSSYAGGKKSVPSVMSCVTSGNLLHLSEPQSLIQMISLVKSSGSYVPEKDVVKPDWEYIEDSQHIVGTL